MLPDPLIRIQFGSIARQLFEMQSRSCAIVKELYYGFAAVYR
jgi:hypothetical protein